MKSMTCYGYASQKTDFGLIEVSIKSVNGRFLEIRTHLPPEYLKLESDIKKRSTNILRRGSVSIFMGRKKDPLKESAQVSVKKDLARNWMKAFHDLSQELKIKSSVSMDTIAQIPNLFVINEDVAVTPKEIKTLNVLIDSALQSCLKEKTREGEGLQKEVFGYLDSLSDNLKVIQAHATKQIQTLKKQHSDKSKVLKSDDIVSDQRLAQEIISQMDRMDISEEIFRFKEHLKSIKKLISSKDLIGKKLDFYTQELLREMNTIGSKSQMFKITQSVVDSKSIIERIREQSQNIE
ncbi:MAG: YicC/YloC family endoribonuclease [Bdellovibrionota bacterium]